MWEGMTEILLAKDFILGSVCSGSKRTTMITTASFEKI